MLLQQHLFLSVFMITTGRYSYIVSSPSSTEKVLCEQGVEGGGWTVIQQRGEESDDDRDFEEPLEKYEKVS